MTSVLELRSAEADAAKLNHLPAKFQTFPMAENKKYGHSIHSSDGDVVGTRKQEIHYDKSPRHQKETHGTSDDIDEKTPVDEVKGPGVLERAKEEIEAVVGAVLPKK